MDSVKTLLQKDRIEDALEVWLQGQPPTGVESELIQLSARFQNHRRIQRSGTQSIEAMTTERNRIRQDLLDLVHEVGTSGVQSSATAPLSTKKIAFLEANPILDRNLQSNIEYREVRELLAKHPDRFQLRAEFAVTLDRMTEMINQYRPDLIHIAIFSTTDYIILHGRADQEVHVTNAEVIAHFDLPDHRPKAILFNTRIGEDLADSLSQGGSLVIGSRTLITNLAAIEFATGFYTALGYGKDYATAFAMGRSVLGRGAYAAERDKLFAYAEGCRVEV